MRIRYDTYLPCCVSSTPFAFGWLTIRAALALHLAVMVCETIALGILSLPSVVATIGLVP